MWNQGFENLNLSCYFNSCMQMYIHCLEIQPWNDTSQSKFHGLVQQLKQYPQNSQQYLKSLNSSLVYVHQGQFSGNDPIRVLSAIIDSTISPPPLLKLKKLPSIFTDYYQQIAENNSETSFLFQSVILSGKWCPICKKTDVESEKLSYFLTLLKEKGSIQEQSIQNLINKMLEQYLHQSNLQQVECSTCSRIMENKKGFVKLPLFLYINLNQFKLTNIENNKQIQIYNEAEQNWVIYELKGVMRNPTFHYTYCRRQNNDKWINFDDSTVSEIQELNNIKGLLFAAVQNGDQNISQIVLKQQQSKNFENQKILLKHQQIFQKYQKLFLDMQLEYESLKILEENEQFFLVRGKKEDNQQNVIIKILNCLSLEDFQQYKELGNQILKIKTNHIFQFKNLFYNKELNSCIIVCEIQDFENLEETKKFLSSDIGEKIQQAIYRQIQQFKQRGIPCSPISIQDIWISSSLETFSILSLHLFSKLIFYQKQQSLLLKNNMWQKKLFRQLISLRDDLPNINEIDTYKNSQKQISEIKSESKNFIIKIKETSGQRIENDFFQIKQKNNIEIELQTIQQAIENLSNKKIQVQKLLEIRQNSFLMMGVQKVKQLLITVIITQEFISYLKIIYKNRSSSQFVMKGQSSFSFSNLFFIIDEIQENKNLKFDMIIENEEKLITIFANLYQQINKVVQENKLKFTRLNEEDIWMDSQFKLHFSSFNILLNENIASTMPPLYNLSNLKTFITQLVTSKYPQETNLEIILNNIFNFNKKSPQDISFNQKSDILQKQLKFNTSSIYLNKSVNLNKRKQKKQFLNRSFIDESNSKVEGMQKCSSIENNTQISLFSISIDEYDALIHNLSMITFEDIGESACFLNDKGYFIQKIDKIGYAGAIIKANWKGERVIIRIFKCQQEEIENFEKEAEQIKTISSSYITQISDYLIHFQQNLIFFVEKEIDGQNYISFFKKEKKNMKSEQKLTMLKEILKGLQQLEDKNIILGNMSNPQTILIKDNLPIFNGFGVLDINSKNLSNILSQNKKINQNIREQLRNQNYQDLTLLINLFENQNEFALLKKQILKNINEKNKIKNIQEFIRMKTDELKEEEMKKVKIDIQIFDRFNNQILEVKSIGIEEQIEFVKAKITNVDLKKCILLDESSQKLENSQSLSYYNITTNSKMIAFNILEEDMKSYNIIIMEQSNTNQSCIFTLKTNGYESIQSVKQLIQAKMNIPIEKQILLSEQNKDYILNNRILLASCKQIKDNTLYLHQI